MGWLDSIKNKKAEEQAQAVLKAIPEELKDKSLDEITAMLREAPSLRTKVSELEASRSADTEKVKTIETEFNALKTRLGEIDASKNQRQTPEELANFVEEPDKAFSQRVGPVATMTVRNAAYTARILAQQQLDNADMASNGQMMDGRLFRAWGSDIDAKANEYQTAQLTDPKAWIGIFYYIKGTRADELRDPEMRKKKYNFLEPAVQTTRQDEPQKKDELTDQEKHVADKMGVKHEDYAKRKKAMQFVSA